MVRAADQRASDAERDEVVELLRTAAGEGRIGHDELEERLSRALRAQTYRQLHATVQDIPRARGPHGRMPQARRTVAGWTVSAVRHEPWLLVVIVPMLVITVTLATIALIVWVLCIVAVLAVGRKPPHPARPLGSRRPGRIGRPGARPGGGIAGSGWRGI